MESGGEVLRVKAYRSRLCVVGCLTLVLVTISVLGLLAMPKVIISAVHARLPITSPQSLLFDGWRNPSDEHITILRRYYIFNCTNAESVVRNGSVPNFVETGPYVYIERRVKPLESISWNPDGTIAYNYQSTMTFVPEQSIDKWTGRQLSRNDNYTIPNGPLFGAAYRLSNMNDSLPIKPVVCDILQPWNDVGIIGVFTHHSAHEILWGYKDALWEVTKIGVLLLDPKYRQPIVFRTNWNGSSIVPGTISPDFGQECPMWDHIGQCNNTMNRLTSEYIGTSWDGGKGLQSIGQMKTWAGQDKLWWWGERGECQQIRGGEGTLFPPGLSNGDTPHFFVDDLYRSLKGLTIDGPKIRGIPTKRVIIHPDTLAVSDDNACYNQNARGIFNLTVALFGPVYGTKPHYADVDMDRVNLTINGKKVTAETGGPTDESQFDVEPITGITMHAFARLQVNLHIRPTHPRGCARPMARTEKLPDTLAPLFWAEREVTINKAKADLLKNDILIPLLAVRIVGYASAALAGLTFLFFLRTLAQMRSASVDSHEYVEVPDHGTRAAPTEATNCSMATHNPVLNASIAKTASEGDHGSS